MKEIRLLLDENEIMTLRLSVRMMELMSPETKEHQAAYMAKILDATSCLDEGYMNEIGKIQRATRRVKKTDQYSEFKRHCAIFGNMLSAEMKKEDDGNLLKK